MKINKKQIALFAIALSSMFNAGCGCTTVKPGYVGIKVPLYGSKETKTEYETVYGRVWYNAWYNDVYIFPTFLQQVVWTKNPNEGSPTDESISFNSFEGKMINCDVALAYSIKEEMVPKIFRDQRRTIEDITDVYLRSKVRDAFVRHASKAHVQDIMGSGKEALLIEVKQDLQVELGPKGYLIDMVSIVGEMRVDPKVVEAISATIAQQQKALEAEAKVKQSEAEGRQAVAVAKGKSDAEIAEAIGKSTARLKIAEAEAQANEKLQKSLSPELLQYQALLKWNGQLPTMMTGDGAVPFINITPPQPTPKK